MLVSEFLTNTKNALLGKGLFLLSNWKLIVAGLLVLVGVYLFGYQKGQSQRQILEAQAEVKQVEKVAKIEQKQLQISTEQRNQYELQKVHIVYLTKEVIRRVPAKTPLCPVIANVLERVRTDSGEALPQVSGSPSGHETTPSITPSPFEGITNETAIINQGNAEQLEVEVLKWRKWYKEQSDALH